MSLFESALKHRGDDLGQLLEFYRPYLLRLAEEWIESDLRPRFSASDAVQQTMVAATVSFEVFQGSNERDFRRWIVSILQNQLVDGWRFHRMAERRDVRKQQVLNEKEQYLPDRESPDFSAKTESIDQLLAAIEGLPEELRVIVRGRYIEDQSFDEIAAKHKVSRETARRRWKEALEKLALQLRGRDE